MQKNTEKRPGLHFGLISVKGFHSKLREPEGLM
jgi:hypothetical protein